MDTETIASAVLFFLLLALSFWAGYGWRSYMEIYRHNRPWLKAKDERKRRAASLRRERLKALWRRLMRWETRRGSTRDEQD